MNFIADGLLLFGSIAAVFYCYILSRRIKKLTNLDSGLGGAIATLSAQVEEMTSTFDAAKRISGASVGELKETTARAEIAAGRLELLLATLHENSKAQDSERNVKRAG